MSGVQNPIRDRFAFAGVGSTGFSRDGGAKTARALTAEACVQAARDAGVSAGDIDAVVGGHLAGSRGPTARDVIGMLGIPKTYYHADRNGPIGAAIVDAVHALHAGAVETVLVYRSVMRTPGNSRAAADDPFRREPVAFAGRRDPELAGRFVDAYASWASRYIYEFEVKREHLGYIALNARTGARANPLAVMRKPMTMRDYLEARMVREPLCLYDMDVPADGADAFILTTADRAERLTRRPVYVHAATLGMTALNGEDDQPSVHESGQRVVVERLRETSEFWVDETDLYFPYDGFSPITLFWLESAGWCAPGEAGALVEESWNEREQRILLRGRVPCNPHGGALSEGATQGSGHVREAILQLRGEAGQRQVHGARTAVLTLGGMLYNAQGLVLRSG